MASSHSPTHAFPLAILILILYGAVSYAEDDRRSVLFNADWLQRSWSNSGPMLSDSVLVPTNDADQLDLTDTYSVVEYVLSHCPTESLVYPSEQYFYFKFLAGHRLISGNLRFIDSDEGKVHFGYFDQHDPNFMYWGTIESGLDGEVSVSGNSVRVSLGSQLKTFILDRSYEKTDGLSLLADEELVTGVLDESGYYFWLVFNRSARRFYYLLNVHKTPEPRHRLDQGGYAISIGIQSRFVFFDDTVRKRSILVGVSADNIRANNYYDGPFDQIPPRLPLREKLEYVYPYTKIHPGIDLHGNFLNDSNSRVAISPYLNYSSTSQFITAAAGKIDSANSDYPFLDLVYEPKMDFDATAHNGKKHSKAQPLPDIPIEPLNIEAKQCK